MKRARVWKVNDGEPDPWVVFVMGEDWLRKAKNDFPTHKAALAHALAEVGLTEQTSAARRDEEKRAACGCDLTGPVPPAVHIVDRHEERR